MPTYEYVCKACGNAWETTQRISEDPIKECPKCHALEAERQISAGNFILKGGGWYADAYSSAPKKSPDTTTATKPDAKSEAKTETKADASPTTTTTTTTPDKKKD